MRPTFFVIYAPLSVIVSCVVASFANHLDGPAGRERPSSRRAAPVAYIPPADNGGSQLDVSAGLGEPLNVIVSALSSEELRTNWGFISWARSLGFSTECFGFHIGGPQTANLGDGRGYVNETAVLRYDYENAIAGSCLESLTGGNHFRYWNQTTTGARFLAVSVEEWAGEHHDIVPDGYDLGRNDLVAKATGKTTYLENHYTTTAYYVSGLLNNGSQGINHNISIDGLVAVLTVTLENGSTKASAALRSVSSPRFSWWILLCVLIYAGAILIVK